MLLAVDFLSLDIRVLLGIWLVGVLVALLVFVLEKETLQAAFSNKKAFATFVKESAPRVLRFVGGLLIPVFPLLFIVPLMLHD